MTLEFTFEQARFYLAALIDGEGYVRYRVPHQQRSIHIVNTDLALIEAAEACCDALGVTSTRSASLPSVRPLARRTLWMVSIGGRANMERVLAVVPLQAPTKLATLRDGVAAYLTDEQRHAAYVAGGRMGAGMTNGKKGGGRRKPKTKRR